MSIITKIFGDPNEKFIKSLRSTVEKINSFELEFKKLTAEQLKEKTGELKDRLSGGETLDDILPPAFALVREAAKRTLNQRHFDVQLIGGIVLHQGKIAEMKTGEGKTLSSTLPAYLNALGGRGVHIVTVNDYLAKRDMVWMGQIYNALGLSVGCITHEGGFLYDENYKNDKGDKERDVVGGFKVVEDFLRPVFKKDAYGADITYGTSHEFGFDYLRDNMAYDLNQVVQRAHNFSIVDEIDSILIDEARVPLIISGPSQDPTDKYQKFTRVVAPLARDTDYTVDEKLKAVHFTEEGQNKVVKSLGADPWADNDIAATHQLEAALRAKTLFLRDKDYVVKNGEVIIIDEFTGRMLPGRRWSQGLHQAVEAKERVKIQPESSTFATITFQNYFRLYKKLAGMTGTALTSAEEFDKVYKLEVVVVPTNKPAARKDFSDKIYKTEEGKLKAVVKEIKKLHQKGQPVLVGTRSVEKNEYLGKLLEREGVPHQILNAKNHQKEGEIIAQAGRKGAVTIATNMAGRGVDIMLGGAIPSKFKVESSNLKVNEEDSHLSEEFKNWQKENKEIKGLGGLFVLGTERHEARRIDDQLRGRSGRQGDPGASQFFVSMEDDLMRIFGGERIKSLMTTLKVPEDEPIQAGLISGAIESAQAKIEGFNFDARNHVLQYDDIMNKQREIIYKKRRAFLVYKDVVSLVIASSSEAGAKQSLEKKKQELGEENFEKAVRFVALKTIDTLWQEHLSTMEHLRDSVRLRAYGGRDPLVEYKNEGRRLFGQLLDEIDATIADNIMKAHVHGTSQNNAEIHAEQRGNQTSNVQQTLNEKVGRNDPCPCGAINPATGEVFKYKKCGLVNASHHKKIDLQKIS